jgi:hypothetical protein
MPAMKERSIFSSWTVAEQPSNFSGKRVIIFPGGRSRYGQHTRALRRASIARAKRAFFMEM